MLAPTSWEDAVVKLNELEPLIEKDVTACKKDMDKYPRYNDNGESLSQLLANLNWYVWKLGELHSKTEAIKTWCEKRYEADKGIEKSRLINDQMAIGRADGAKYIKVEAYIGTMARAGALHLRVQNARSSARDTTEGIRSRIGQLRGQMRS